MSTYLWINLASISIPLIFTFHPRIRFHHTWGAFWPAVALTALLFITWDIYYTLLGVWGFNPLHLSGIDLLNLPIEEWLFFICIPYACVFTYHCIKKFYGHRLRASLFRHIAAVLALILIQSGILFIDKLYTGVTCLATGLALAFLTVVVRPGYFGPFLITYGIIFIFPFLIVNGILTGLFIEESVVWYNDTENLGVRVLTIPLEDFAYGMLLLLLNISIYEKLLKRQSAAEHVLRERKHEAITHALH